MNIVFIKHFFVVFMVSEIPIVSVFGHCPYYVTFRIRLLSPIEVYIYYIIGIPILLTFI